MKHMNVAPDIRDEMDWRDLLKQPHKLFGYSYLYVLVLVSALGYAYIVNLSVIGKNSVPPAVLADSSARVEDIPFQSPRIVPPVDVLKVGVPSNELVAKGRDLFKANCASCHGDNGMGDGPAGALLVPPPRNFHSTEGWKNGSKVSQMYKTLQEGIPGSSMASFSYLPPEDRFALIHYERSFTAGHPTDTPDELKQLDATYGLSKGMNVAGQVPVKKAMRIVREEAAGLLARLRGAVQSVDRDSSKGAAVFREVTFDRMKAFASVLHAETGSAPVGGRDAFLKMISADPLHAGFKPNVMQLSLDEWALLYNYALGVAKE